MSRSPRTAAARRARENARAFAERQARLLAIAEEFFTLQENTEAAKIENEIIALEKKLAALRDQLEDAREEEQRIISAPVAAMKALNEPSSDIAQRLGLTRAQVNALLRVHEESTAE